MRRTALPTALLLCAVASALLGGCFSGAADDTGDEGGEDGGDPGPTPDDGVADPTLARTGRWLAPFDGQVPAVNMVLLHNGRVLYWSGVEADGNATPEELVFLTTGAENATSRVLDLSGDSPVILEPVNPDGAGADLFCAGQTLLPDGRVLAVGSSQWHTLPTTEPFLRGGTDARIYDPANNTWTRGADMLFGRWYPSAITLPDGRALVASGIGSLTNVNEHWPQMETYDPATDAWTYYEGADRLLPLYPRLTVVPGGPLRGHLFYNTVGTLWGPFGEHPRQAEWAWQADLDLAAPAWTTDDLSVFGTRQHASSVMLIVDPANDYAPTFVTFGGTLQQSALATPFTELSDLGTDPPTNTLGPAMANPRWHLNGVVLPTGEALAIGGGLYDNVIAHGQQNIPILPAEWFDADTGTWQTLAAMTVPRMYHSTALLLPDGRVLAGGHVPLPNPSDLARETVNPQVVETRLEVFEPPYLFRGPRPVVAQAPGDIAYGATFDVTVDDASRIRDVVLMHPGATTHAFDASQRAIRLAFAAGDDGALHITAPPSSIVAPPGHYMLFVLGEGEGGLVPAVAPFLHLA